jgi:hypothetical protein
VPTTEGITTHAQITARVADTTISKLVIEAPISFPSQAPITIEPDQSISIAGRSAIDGGRVTLDGAGHSRHFHVLGGTVHLTHLNLVNGSAPNPSSGDKADFGGAILVADGGILVMHHCDVIGMGEGADKGFGTSALGAISLGDAGTTGTFFNVTFAHNRASWASAISMFDGTQDGPVVANFYFCVFRDNGAKNGYAVLVGWSDIYANFYDCLFERNQHGALLFHESTTYQKGEIVRCTFRDNTGFDGSWPNSGAAVVISSCVVPIIDSVFEGNIGGGDDGVEGGALSFIAGSVTTLRNVSFLSNEGYIGGMFAAMGGSSVTLIRCFGRANRGGSWAGGFYVEESTVTIYNSTFAETYTHGWTNFRIVSSVVSIYNTVIRDGTTNAGQPNFGVYDSGCVLLVVDSTILNGRTLSGPSGLVSAESGAQVSFLRTTIDNMRTESAQGGTAGAGCVSAFGGATVTIEDCVMMRCHAEHDGGAFWISEGGLATIKRSRIIASAAGWEGNVAVLEGTGVIQIIDSTIRNSSGGNGKFAVKDTTGNDFSLQLDTVVVDDTFSIMSEGKVLVQNCDGFSGATIKNSSAATCASTSDFCLRDSCLDKTVGIDCRCEVDGVMTQFPTDCMQSAVLEVGGPFVCLRQTDCATRRWVSRVPSRVPN